jgi:hypothetical protein
MKRLCAHAPIVMFFLVLPTFAQLRRTPVLVSPDGRRALNSQTYVLGQEVLAEGEPSFQKVARYFPSMFRTQVPISVKDHPDEFIVGFDGTLMLRAGEEIDFRLGDPPNPYGIDGGIQRSLLGGYLPIPQICWAFNGLSYEETVFGYSKDFSPDEPLQAYVRFRVTNLSSAPRDARVTMLVAPTFKMNANPAQAAVVDGHGHVDFYFRIPYSTDSAKMLAETKITGVADYEARLAEVRAYWKSYLDGGTQIDTPEPFINNAWRAWELYNTLNVDKVKGRYEVHDGSGFYEEEFGYSVALYCQALSLLGHHEDAEKYIESMLAVQKPSGQYITVYGTPDNGALLFAIGQEYRLSRNDGWLRRVLPKALMAMQWVRDSRAKTRVLEGGRKPLGYGLLPAGPAYCDFQNLVVSYYSDTYNWLGLHEMSIALREAGMQREAADWTTEADAYHQDISESMQAAVFKDHGIDILPVEPLTHRLEKEGAFNYYSLIAPLILETEFFSATDQHYRWITDFMEQRGGLLLGLSRLWDGGTDHAYTYGYALEQLRHGNVDAFLLTFYSSLAYGMTQDTYSAVEANGITEGFNADTLPHTYSNSQQLRMLRMMLVKEESDELWIGSGVPKAWLDALEGFSLTNGATNYGPLSYRVSPEPAAKLVKVSIDSSFLSAPSKVRVRLASNFGALESATINGSAAHVEHDAVVFDGSMLRGKLEILARYK